MPTPEHLEVAQLLLQKAEGDLAAARLLASDPSQADHVVGFHAQQAVEKSLKAVLAVREVEIPLSHDLGFLVKLCEAADPVPSDVAGSSWLTPWQAACATRLRPGRSIASAPSSSRTRR